MRKFSLAILAITAVFLAGCVGETKKKEFAATEPAPRTTAVVPWVQDLWVYDNIQTVAPGGDVVDLTDHILGSLDTPSRSEPLPNGATFHIHDTLAPTVTSAGSVRADLSVIAGVIEWEGVRALAALATPLSDAEASVGINDTVELDLTFLGDLLHPGDPIVTDVIFIQARPGEGEPSLDDVALLAERMTQGRAFSYGVHIDEELLLQPLTAIVGEAVAGSTRMSVPGKGGLPFPDITGPGKALFCPRVALGPSEARKCLENYFEEMIEVAEQANDLLECNFGLCLPQPPPHEPLCIGLGCPPPAVRSDPHLLSFDGQTLSMQGVGEYVLSRGTGIEIQMRTAAAGAHRTASALTMVAVAIGDDRAVIGNDNGNGHIGVWVNDSLIPYSVGEQYLQQSRHGAFNVTQTAHEVLIEASDGSMFYIRRGLSNWLDFSLKLSHQTTGLTGLLGDNDGDSRNDWRARDGSVLNTDATGREIYAEFSDTWRVTDEESILRYQPGENTGTFTDESYPEQIVTLADLETSTRTRAERLCRLAGVSDDVLLAQCTLDYALTGDIAFVLSAQYVERDRDVYAAYLASDNQNTRQSSSSPAAPSAWALSPGSTDAPDSDVFMHVCPPAGTAHSVWGGNDGIYTSDSSICTAAVHAGLITIEHGGTVEVTRLEGLDDYGLGSTLNGITTRKWQHPWHGSFRVDD